VVTASIDGTARIWDVTWATHVRGDALRERVCAEKLVGAAQEFSDDEMDDPVLRGIDKDDPVARNARLRRGLPSELWRFTHALAGAVKVRKPRPRSRQRVTCVPTPSKRDLRMNALVRGSRLLLLRRRARYHLLPLRADSEID
jgi:hypothetical protein